MDETTNFQMKVAELQFAVSCSHAATWRLCRDYRTVCCGQVMPVEIREADIEEERLRILNNPNREPELETASSESLEGLVLCRALAEQLPAHGRILFHGSSLAIDGKGVLFTAKSGTGKSTHTRLWREVFGDRVVMVNDDKPFLHITPEETTVYGTPWRGKHRLGSNISAPLKAICILCRGTENRVEPVSARAALPVLLQQTYMPEDPRMLQRTLALADRLSRTVPIYKLYCNMDPEAAVVAYGGLNLEE